MKADTGYAQPAIPLEAPSSASPAEHDPIPRADGLSVVGSGLTDESSLEERPLLARVLRLRLSSHLRIGRAWLSDPRHRLVALVALVAVVSALVGWVAASLVKSPAEALADTAAPARRPITAAVQSRVMTSDVVARGTVVADRVVSVSPQLASEGAKPVVTGVRVKPGQSLRAGTVLMEVSGRPVLVLQGDVPAYRDMRPGSSGKDVAQLQAALSRLGLRSDDQRGLFGAGTKRAVAALYTKAGYEPAPSGPDDAATLRAAAGAVRSAQRAVESAQRAVGAAAGPDAKAEARVNLGYAKEDLSQSQQEYARVVSTTGVMVPAGEIVYMPSFPARVEAVDAAVGGPVPDKAIRISTGQLQAVVRLDRQSADQLKPGQPAGIDSEQLGIKATGKVTAITKTAPAGLLDTSVPVTNPGSVPVIDSYAIIKPDQPLDDSLAGTDVRVDIQAASSGQPVLVVPVAALSTSADARTTVEVVEASGQARAIEVRTGLISEGFAEISPIGGQLTDGEQVSVGVSENASAPP